MTSAGGPSWGPRGLVDPKNRHMRGKSHAASPSRSRSAGGRSSPVHVTLEELAAHQLLHRFGKADAPIRRLVVLEKRDEDPWGSERRIVERVREAHFAIASAITDVRPPGLPVVERRAAVRLAILAEARNPALDIVHSIFAEPHVARRSLDHLVGNFQIPEQ